MTDTILWDNDGVLVDTEGLYFQATQEVMRTVDVELTREQYVEYFLRQGTGAWHLAQADEEKIEALRQRRNERYGELLRAEARTIEGIEETLEALRAEYRMGVVTSSRPDHFEIIHASTGLLPYFDFVVTSADVTEMKPHPAPYLKALELAGRSPGECVVVEDSARGLLAAHAAGIPCYVIPTRWTRTSDFSLAAGVLERAGDLPERLRQG